MADKLPVTTDINLDSPSEYEFMNKQFWKEDIDNNDYLRMYKRKGVVFRTINKETELMFKRGWKTSDKKIQVLIDEFNLNDIARYSYLNSAISGKSLIYVNYGDGLDYSEAPSENARAIGYYVIPLAWVYRDMYYNQEVFDYYEIYKADGTMFKVHKDRFIRVQYNKDEISKILPAYDSLQVLDNVMWGTGQTMFRSGSGFPVLKVKNGSSIISLPNGTNKTRMQYYKDMGFLRDMNTQTGFIHDEMDQFTFEGANGKAMQPKEFYEVAFQQVAVDLDVPVDVLKGISAGAVTGSETNLKIYYGDLNAKQKDKLEKIYDDLFSTLGVYDVDYKWEPIFEQTQGEIIINLKNDVGTLYQLELYGYYTHEQVVDYLSRNYPSLNFDDEKINKLKNNETYIKPAGFNLTTDGESLKIGSDMETSALPTKVQKYEKAYGRELNKAFEDTNKQIGNLLAAFNTE